MLANTSKTGIGIIQSTTMGLKPTDSGFGWASFKARPAIVNPSSVLPASPMNVRIARLNFSGRLNSRNAATAPNMLPATSSVDSEPVIDETYMTPPNATSPALPARPSRPSSMLKALISATTAKTRERQGKGAEPYGSVTKQIAKTAEFELRAVQQRNRGRQVRKQADVGRQVEAVVQHTEGNHEPCHHQQADTAVLQALPADGRDQQARKHRHATDNRYVAMMGLAAAGLVNKAGRRRHRPQGQEHRAGHEKRGNGCWEDFHDRSVSSKWRPRRVLHSKCHIL